MGRNIVIFNFYISLPHQSFDMENISEIKEFNKLFSNYQGIFIRFANTYIQDEDTAEDIVVDSLVKPAFSQLQFEYPGLYHGSSQT